MSTDTTASLENTSSWVFGLFLATLVVVVYGNSFSNELVFDSGTVVGLDPRVKELTWENLGLIFTEQYWWPNAVSGLYRPLTTFSYLVNSTVLGAGSDPFGFQVVNIFLHWVVLVLIWILGRRLGMSKASAFCAAALFGLHPLMTESVVNIVGRADQFAAISVLGCTILAIDARRSGWTILRIFAFSGGAVAGLLTKENAIVLVPLMIALGVLALPFRTGRDMESHRATRRWWIPVGSVVFVLCCCFLWARWWWTYVKPYGFDPFVDNPIVLTDWWAGRLTALSVLVDSLVAVFAPILISADYSYAQIPVATGGLNNATDIKGWIGVLFVVGAAVTLVRGWIRGGNRGVFLATACIACLIPTSNLLVQIGSIRADRFLYLPFTFGSLLLVDFLWRACTKMSAKVAYAFPRKAISVLVAVWLLSLAVLAHVRTYDWRSNRVLWESALLVSPNSYKVHQNLGVVLMQRASSAEEVERAVSEIKTACRILETPPLPLKHRVARAYTNLGSAYASLAAFRADSGDLVAAEELNERADNSFREGLAVTDAVVDYFTDSVAARGIHGESVPLPYAEHAVVNYAEFLIERSRAGEAIPHLEGLLDLQPTDITVRLLAAKACSKSGAFEDAFHHVMWAIVLGSTQPEVSQITREILANLTTEDQPTAFVWTGEGNLVLNVDNPEVEAELRTVVDEVHTYLVKRGDSRRASRLLDFVHEKLGLDLTTD